MSPPPFPTHRRELLKAMALGAAIRPTLGLADAPSPVAGFSLGQASLSAGPFLHAQTLNRRYLAAHDPDRFLAPFRQEAGLDARAERYPNWESSGLDGHSAGHYLTALAQTAASGDSELADRLRYMIGQLAECQRANGNGYVGGIPGGKPLWRDIGAGKIDADGFRLNGHWVPFYNLHKLFAGLRDAWWLAGLDAARDVLLALAAWCRELSAKLDDDQLQDILRCEHGGMNEVLADVYAISGDRRYLELARRWSHRAVLDPLLRREDRLDGLHANTQIPKVIGFARIGELSDDAEWTGAARYFWESVVYRRNVAIGGNSVREHFNPRDDFSSMVESTQGPETCNSYNLLRLTEILYRAEPSAHYADYCERTLFNHILSTQHPGHGGLVYFTPMRPRHYRVYSQPGQCFWCCVGSGMENHGKYAGFIYARHGDALIVNQYIASQLEWPEYGLQLQQETGFPDEARSSLRLSLQRPRRFTLRLRHPAWVRADALRLTLNGAPWHVESTPSSYIEIAREWHDGDRIEIELPMHTRVERLPDGSDCVAFVHGPIVLAARTGTEDLDGLVAGAGRMAHDAPGPLQPLDEAPVLLAGSDETLAAGLKPVPGQALTFTAPALIRPEKLGDTLRLMPFFRLHDARYMIYWRTTTAAAYPALMRELRAKESARLALDARTLDRITPGEQQPEVEHGLRERDSETGIHHGRHFRRSRQWFGYTLSGGRNAAALWVVYDGGERQRRFSIELDGQPIAEVELDGAEPDRFIEAQYPIPESLSANADGALTLRFVAAPQSSTAAVFEVRLLAR